MDFTEFRRLLAADPRNQDPAFLQARASSPEFRDAAAEADRFEERLERALALDVPPDLLDRIHDIPRGEVSPVRHAAEQGAWWRFALAASLLLAIGAAGLTWRMNTGWNSVEDYVVDHYHHDGLAVLALADGPPAADVSGMLAEFGATAAPELAGIISVIKNCPTPDGKGVHMVLNTDRGLITVIYMPETLVRDGEHLLFDDSEAVLVELRSGSAVIIGSRLQRVSELHSLVQNSIVTADGNI
jgi:hypothetical protein